MSHSDPHHRSAAIDLCFARAPNAATYMAQAFLPKRAARPFTIPPGHARWSQVTPVAMIPPRLHASAFRGTERWAHPIYLHAASMRLMMALVTHRRFPVPIWGLLQVRNRIEQLQAVRAADALEWTAQVDAWRVYPKGVEIDLAVEAEGTAGLALRSLTTFFVRGRFGEPAGESQAPSPEPPTGILASWSIPSKGVRAFAELTGDYNGIHWMDVYARAFGFRGAFSHPHRVLAGVVDHLAGDPCAAGLRLSAWFKGPVYYERPIELATAIAAGEAVFAVRVADDPRPAMVGTMTRVEASPRGPSPSTSTGVALRR